MYLQGFNSDEDVRVLPGSDMGRRIASAMSTSETLKVDRFRQYRQRDGTDTCNVDMMTMRVTMRWRYVEGKKKTGKTK